ncbi:hypothetical protein R6Q59_027773 [Mikania micrantha]
MSFPMFVICLLCVSQVDSHFPACVGSFGPFLISDPYLPDRSSLVWTAIIFTINPVILNVIEYLHSRSLTRSLDCSIEEFGLLDSSIHNLIAPLAIRTGSGFLLKGVKEARLSNAILHEVSLIE